MDTRPTASDESDRERVRELLGRQPQGGYTVVVRDPAGDPVVLRNAPLLDDGTPMPTRYWLVGPDEIRRIGRLESAGGVDAAERQVDPAELAAAHARYAAERDAALPPGHTGPRPSGGVGGTRLGVKCLHSHWAWHLAGGDDPVGRWIADQLATEAAPRYLVRPDTIALLLDDASTELPIGPSALTRRWLADHDPPRPGELTNALGDIDDHLDDAERILPGLVAAGRPTFRGAAIAALARLELGLDVTPPSLVLTREAAEEVFRIVATEPARDRADNPGLPPDHVATIVATCCIVVAVMRRHHLDSVSLDCGEVAA